MIIKKTTKKYPVSDRNKLRALRIQIESTEHSHKLGMIPEDEYKELLLNISKQVKQMEDKYGIK